MSCKKPSYQQLSCKNVRGIFGLSATAMRAKGFTLVRACVRSFVTRYLGNRASDFDDFCTKLYLDDAKKNVPLVCPPGGFLTQKKPFLA